MPGWIGTPGRCCVPPGQARGRRREKKVRGHGPTPLAQLPVPPAHLLGVVGWDLLEALAGLPESHVLCTELLLQELLGGGERGRQSDRDLIGECIQRDWDRHRAKGPARQIGPDRQMAADPEAQRENKKQR